jgi:hypothetical protein
MIVLPPGETYDPETDKYFIVSHPPQELFGSNQLLMNGLPQPASILRFRVGETYRLRFMNITPTGDALHLTLYGPSGPVQWRPLAKDAAETGSTGLVTADQQVAVGETFDFEYSATKKAELRLEAWVPGANQRAVQTILVEDD